MDTRVLNQEISRRFVLDVWERGDRAAAEAIVADDVVVHGNVVPGQPPGPAGQLYAAAVFRAAFPDMRWTVEDVIADSDRVVDRWTMRATHQGAFGGVAATGRTVTWTGIDILRIVDGKIVDIWHEEGDLSQQLGTIGTAPASVAEANKATVVRYFLESHNAPYDLAVIDETCDPAYGERMTQWLHMERAAFPDKHVTIEAALADGDQVALRWTFRGTHLGDFRTPVGIIPATGRPIELTSTAIYRLVDGRIVEEQNTHDWLRLIEHLGGAVHLPVPATRS
jgi:steroid delta-isomerase-like uncharacterized protein